MNPAEPGRPLLKLVAAAMGLAPRRRIRVDWVAEFQNLSREIDALRHIAEGIASHGKYAFFSGD